MILSPFLLRLQSNFIIGIPQVCHNLIIQIQDVWQKEEYLQFILEFAYGEDVFLSLVKVQFHEHPALFQKCVKLTHVITWWVFLIDELFGYCSVVAYGLVFVFFVLILRCKMIISNCDLKSPIRFIDLKRINCVFKIELVFEVLLHDLFYINWFVNYKNILLIFEHRST